jgi:hypothetical protein
VCRYAPTGEMNENLKDKTVEELQEISNRRTTYGSSEPREATAELARRAERADRAVELLKAITESNCGDCALRLQGKNCICKDWELMTKIAEFIAEEK